MRPPPGSAYGQQPYNPPSTRPPGARGSIVDPPGPRAWPQLQAPPHSSPPTPRNVFPPPRTPTHNVSPPPPHSFTPYPPARPPYDPQFKGPDKDRGFTDVFCALVFVVFLILYLTLILVAFIHGDPLMLQYPVDSSGHVCGYGQHAIEDKLLFFDLVVCGKVGAGVFVRGCPTPQVCVSKCPDKNYYYLEDVQSDNKGNLICQEGVDTSSKTVEELVNGKYCASYYLNSYSILNRCVPGSDLLDLGTKAVELAGGITLRDSANLTITGNDIKLAKNMYIAYLDAQRGVDTVVTDLRNSWRSIVVFAVVTMLGTCLWILIMNDLVGPMIWLSISVFWIFTLTAAIICFVRYDHLIDSGEVFGFDDIYVSKKTFYIVFGIFISIIWAVFSLILLALCNRIRTAVALIHECSRAIAKMVFTLLWPIFPFIIEMCIVVLWLSVAVHIASLSRTSLMMHEEDKPVDWDRRTVSRMKVQSENLFKEYGCTSPRARDYDAPPDYTPHITNTTSDPNNNTPNIITTTVSNRTTANNPTTLNPPLNSGPSKEESDYGLCGTVNGGYWGAFYDFLQFFNAFMGFWLLNFAIGLEDMTMAGVFAIYYWTFDKHHGLPAFPILRSFARSFFYHFGSIALGSLLIASLEIFRVILEYVRAQVVGKQNGMAKFIVKCMACCFACTEKFLKYITKKTYIMIAILGKPFWWSCKHSINLILRNKGRVLVVDWVTEFVILISRVAIIAGVTVTSFYFYKGDFGKLSYLSPQVTYEAIPICIVILAAYLITDVFFDVFSMAVETIFLSFLTDLEMHDGSVEKPYFMSKGLMKILTIKNKERHGYRADGLRQPIQPDYPSTRL